MYTSIADFFSGKELKGMAKTVAIGIQSFDKIREGNYFYVDKTDFIRQLIDGHSAVTLLTRPRRFGKTLTLSMTGIILEKMRSIAPGPSSVSSRKGR